MKNFKPSFKKVALTAALLSVVSLSSNAGSTPRPITLQHTSKLLTANFTVRDVVKINVGDFHFTAGQVAPVHTHVAPAIGYVSKGAIIYQVEGEKPQLLKAGDVFYEPVGPRILRFDNASATDEAVFIDFNLQQKDEPFIVFEKPLTEKIDRRTLPTVKLAGLKGQSIDQVNVFVSDLAPSASASVNRKEVLLAYVAEGIVNVKVKGKGKVVHRVVAGSTFSLPKGKSTATLVNTSAEVAAKVITFYLR